MTTSRRYKAELDRAADSMPTLDELEAMCVEAEKAAARYKTPAVLTLHLYVDSDRDRLRLRNGLSVTVLVWHGKDKKSPCSVPVARVRAHIAKMRELVS